MAAPANPEGLDEMWARRSRAAAANWPDGTGGLEDAGTNVWQPETLCYTPLDQSTGAAYTVDGSTPGEAWRCSNAPLSGTAGYRQTVWDQDISNPRYTADGKRLVLQCFGRTSHAVGYSGTAGSSTPVVYAVRADGTYFRPLVGAKQKNWKLTFTPDPQVPDRLWESTITYPTATLWATAIGDASATPASVVSGINCANPLGGVDQNYTRRAIGADGKTILCCFQKFDNVAGSNSQGQYSWFNPVRVVGTTGSLLGAAAPYPADRGYGAYGDLYNATFPRPSGAGAYYIDFPLAVPSAAAPPASNTAGISAPAAAPTQVTNYSNGSSPGYAYGAGGAGNAGNFVSGQTLTVAYTYVTASGETTASPTLAFAMPSQATAGFGYVPRVSIPNPPATTPAIVGINVYASTAGAGGLALYGQVTGIAFSGASTAATLPYGAIYPIPGYHDWWPRGLLDAVFVEPGGSNSDFITTGSFLVCIQSLTGSATDGGPLWSDTMAHTPSQRVDFGDVVPYNHWDPTSAGNRTAPGVQASGTPDSTHAGYHSHKAFDRWGRVVAYSGSNNSPVGDATWDHVNSQAVVNAFLPNGSADATTQHRDWSGFSDWFASSNDPGAGATTAKVAYLYTHQYATANSSRVVCCTFDKYNNSGIQYYSTPRPGQSPDGTKVTWHGTAWSTSDANADIFWAVAYYPYPATTLDAATTGTTGQARVRWLPPRYTTRNFVSPSTGLVDESGGEPLYAREVRQYRVWRAPSSAGPWTPVGTTAASYANDATTNTLWPVVGGSHVSASNKIAFDDAPGDGTWYYAVTTEEWSGLSSRNLSDVIQVVVSGTSVSSSVAVVGGPPTGQLAGNAQAGATGFWTTAPAPPAPLTTTPSGTAGVNNLAWSLPSDPDGLLRHVNLYYSQAGNPAISASTRVASVAVGNAASWSTTYIDWLAGQSGSHFYAATCVDRYGNEGAPAYSAAGNGRRLTRIRTAAGSLCIRT